jgi:hypothetical protein
MLRKQNGITLLLVVLVTTFLTYLSFTAPRERARPPIQHGAGGVFPSYAPVEPANCLFLMPEQCDAAFPGLNKEIEHAVAQGPVQLKRLKDKTPGLVQGRIKNGKVSFVLRRIFSY